MFGGGGDENSRRKEGKRKAGKLKSSEKKNSSIVKQEELQRYNNMEMNEPYDDDDHNVLIEKTITTDDYDTETLWREETREGENSILTIREKTDDSSSSSSSSKEAKIDAIISSITDDMFNKYLGKISPKVIVETIKVNKFKFKNAEQFTKIIKTE